MKQKSESTVLGFVLYESKCDAFTWSDHGIVCCRTPVHALGSHKCIVTIASSINPIVTPKGNENLCVVTVNSS